MYNFENLLHEEIKQKLSDKNITLGITLSAKDCEQRWPRCRISLDNEIIFDNFIVNEQRIKFHKNFTDDRSICVLKLEMYGKTNQDTKIDNIGNIVSNQMIQIEKLFLNEIDIIKNNLIYQGKFKMTLDTNKIKYFKENNISIENHDYHFYENGIWTLQIGLPVLTYIINNTKQSETFEKIPYDDIMMAIVNKLEI